MPHRPWSLVAVFSCLGMLAGCAGGGAPRARALLIVDNSVYPDLKEGLVKYAQHVRQEQNIVCVPRPDDYYSMKPPAIRAILQKEYKKAGPRLVGAIMVGPIPYALSGNPKEITIPTPMFYEDFNAKWEDPDGDGVFQTTYDRVNNPTEIWTAWWVPPANDGPTQVKLLKGFLDKLDRYYRGEITGTDGMLFQAGNVTSVEVTEGWMCLMGDTLQSVQQTLATYSRVCEDKTQPKPASGPEFTAAEFISAYSSRPWQHLHIGTHGTPEGFYWENTALTGIKPEKPAPDRPWLDFSQFKGTGANIVTTSGCSNGNFRGTLSKTDYARSIGNLMLFSPNTITVAFYGSASPQSTSEFAVYHTELIESLKADGKSYLAEGYYKMRNHDYSWGTSHYIYRGGDEKMLSGDPFARYRSAPAAKQVAGNQPAAGNEPSSGQQATAQPANASPAAATCK
jgi:hypothetical protein